MAKALDETTRRRAKQVAYNLERGLGPQPLRKWIADILDDIVRDDPELVSSGRNAARGKAPVPGMSSRPQKDRAGQHARELAGMPRAELSILIQSLSDQMHDAARDLQFKLAARLRDEVNELKKELRVMDAAGVR